MRSMLLILCLGACLISTVSLVGCSGPSSTASKSNTSKSKSSPKARAESKTKDPQELLEARTEARQNAKQPIDPENLAGIPREISVEPEYKGNSRHYYLLVFDEDETKKVWLAFDGESLYVDCNLNGDLTDEGEAFPTNANDAGSMFRVIEGVKFTMPDGEPVSLTYTFPDEKFDEFQVRIRAQYRGATFAAWGDHDGDVPDAALASQAPILRVNGPLQMGFEIPARWAIESLDNDKFEVNVGVGTPGLGAGTFMHLKYWDGAIPKWVSPEVEIHFPPEEEGNPAVVARGKLRSRC